MFQIEKSMNYFFSNITDAEEEKDKFDDLRRENKLLREHISMISSELIESRTLLKKNCDDNSSRGIPVEAVESNYKSLQIKELEILNLSNFVCAQSNKIRELEDKLHVSIFCLFLFNLLYIFFQ